MDQLCRLQFHISSTHRVRDEKIFSEGSHRLSVSGKTICFDLEEKVTSPFCEASLRLCSTVPVWWWEALDLSRIAQPPLGPPVHCYVLRRGRLWIAEVVSAFYQNRLGFCAIFPKRGMKSVCCSNTQEQWWNSAKAIEFRLMFSILRHFRTKILQKAGRKWLQHFSLYNHENVWSSFQAF